MLTMSQGAKITNLYPCSILKLKKMKTTLILIGILITVNTSLWSQNSDSKGREIVQKAINIADGENRRSLMHISSINKRGRERNIKLIAYSIDINEDTKSLMFINEPFDVKGTGFLSWDYNDSEKDDDKWLYLPAMKKIRRISGSSSKTEYFMGTDFTYDDMSKRNIDEETYKLLKEEVYDGYPCWVIESAPTDSKSIYSKKTTWIRKDNYMSIKVDFYDKMDNLLKTLTSDGIKKVDGFWVATKLTMVNIQNGHKTIMNIESIRYNLNIPGNIFTVNYLEKGNSLIENQL